MPVIHVVSLLFIMAMGLIAPQPASPRFGVAEVNDDSTGCVATARWQLQAGDSVLVVLLEPLEVADAVIDHQIEGSCWGERQGVLGDSVFAYALRWHPRGEFAGGIGAAIVAPGASATVDSAGLRIWIRGGREPYTFRSCASMEGIHFTAWQGQRRVWHEYYYVPFDLEPDCTDAEIGEDDAR